MRTTWRDLVATVLVTAIAVPYIGYLVRGEMPFVEDPRGMAATGLALGLAAFIVLGIGDAHDRLGMTGTAVALFSLGLGVVALALAETAAAEVLLAVFMGSIALVWLMALANDFGMLPHRTHPG